MRAALYRHYGPPEVLVIQEIAQPIPTHNEVLIRVRAATVSSADWRARSLVMPAGFGLIGRPLFGLARPRQPILGTELAGDVVAVGNSVRNYRIGDRVFAYSGFKMGCYVEYKCFPESGPIAKIPAEMSYAQAAALCFGGVTMLDFFKRGALARGERVLINGASGCVGSAAVQLAKHFGAHITAVCSTSNFAMVQALGADCLIDYKRQDFSQLGDYYDVIVDTVGTAPFAKCRPVLSSGGRLLLVLGSIGDMFRMLWTNGLSDVQIIAGSAAEHPRYVQQIGQLSAIGAFRPAIDRCYAFDQIVEAHHYVDRGHKKGNVVLILD